MRNVKNYRRTMKLLEESENYIVITESGGSVNANKSNIITMITMFLRELKESKNLDDEDIDKIAHLAKASDDELRNEAADKLGKLLKGIFDEME